MPCHYSKGGEVPQIECPSCGHSFDHEMAEGEEIEPKETNGDEAAEHAMADEAPPVRMSFADALKRRRSIP